MDELLRQLMIEILMREMQRQEFRPPPPQFLPAPQPIQNMLGPLESHQGTGGLLHGLLREPLAEVL